MTIIYLIIIINTIYRYILDILYPHTYIYTSRRGGRAGVTMQHVNIRNIFDFSLLKIEQ